jgi:hypothetical protein
VIGLQFAQHFVDQRLVFDHQQVRIENPGIFRTDCFRDLLLHLEDLRPRLDERVLEAGDFVGDIGRVDLVSHDVVSLDREDVDGPARNPGGGGHTVPALFLVVIAIAVHSGARIAGTSTTLR